MQSWCMGIQTLPWRGALAASKLQIPVIHVEAGIRSDYYLPEEVNRVLTDQLSAYLFCPSESARAQLLKTGFSPDKLFVSGDIMYDSTLFFTQKFKSDTLSEWGLTPKNFIYVTLHREENITCQHRLSVIVNELIAIAKQQPVVFSLHPATKKRLHAYSLYHALEQSVLLIPPQPYINSLGLCDHAKLVITDSGGLQKEAYYLRTPAFVLRQNTEWSELLDTGLTVLMPPSKWPTLHNAPYPHLTHSLEPYGHGETARFIHTTLKCIL